MKHRKHKYTKNDTAIIQALASNLPHYYVPTIQQHSEFRGKHEDVLSFRKMIRRSAPDLSECLVVTDFVPRWWNDDRFLIDFGVTILAKELLQL